MTADQCEKEDECEKAGDGSSILLSSSNERPKNAMSARRKMWGEDGSGARRIKLSR
jgi:hypothetical protein